jgi:VanZ family protein
MESKAVKPASVLWWIITVAWAAQIFFLSTHGFSPHFTGRLLALALDLLHIHVSPRTFGLLHGALRKLAHVVEYAIFALLLYGHPSGRGLESWRPRRAVVCVAIAAAYSLTDEFHQWFVPGRHASLRDCGLDTIGASLAMLVPYARERVSHLRSHRKHS